MIASPIAGARPDPHQNNDYGSTCSSMLSRGVAGVRRGTLITNVPGNPKAGHERLAAIAAALPHAVSTLKVQVGDHSRPA